MPTTANKSYSTPAYNTAIGTWGTSDMNGNFTAIDYNLGGVTTVTLSNANVTLNSTQAQNLTVFLTGTLSASVTVSTPCVGFFWIVNNTTGAYTVNIQANFGSGAVGSAVPVTQGSRILFVSDTTNGLQLGASSFASGTTTVFYQASAPSGWTQSASLNDYALRIVSGTGGSSHSNGNGVSALGGIINSNGYTLTITDIPSHNHTDYGHVHSGVYGPYGLAAGGGSGFYVAGSPSANTGTGYANISYTGGGGPHAHGVPINLNYADLILCVKN